MDGKSVIEWTAQLCLENGGVMLPTGSTRAGGWVSAYGFSTQDETLRTQAKTRLTMLGAILSAGRRQGVVDGIVGGHLVNVKGTRSDRLPGTDITTGRNLPALRAHVEAGRPFFVLLVRGDVAPDAIPAGGVGEVKPAIITGWRRVDVAPTLRAMTDADWATIRHGDEQAGRLAYLRPMKSGRNVYPRLRVRLSEIETGWLDNDWRTDGLEALTFPGKPAVRPANHGSKALATATGPNGKTVTLHPSGQVNVGGRKWAEGLTGNRGRVLAGIMNATYEAPFSWEDSGLPHGSYRVTLTHAKRILGKELAGFIKSRRGHGNYWG